MGSVHRRSNVQSALLPIVHRKHVRMFAVIILDDLIAGLARKVRHLCGYNWRIMKWNLQIYYVSSVTRTRIEAAIFLSDAGYITEETVK